MLPKEVTLQLKGSMTGLHPSKTGYIETARQIHISSRETPSTATLQLAQLTLQAQLLSLSLGRGHDGTNNSEE